MTRLIAAVFLLSAVCFAECVPIEKAKDKIGSNACVTGKVVKIGHTPSGTTFLDFCEDYKSCPFVVVIFARDLKDVGDVSQLEGKVIEISGKVEEYNGRAEIVLKDVKQLRGDAANIPAVPKTFDAAKRGKFSAGKISKSATAHTSSKQPRKPNSEPEID
jgi:RecJ-like exonuclease